ncbi:hypothetical protein RN001_013672 [Aquatica leii]|uniref:Uncharacterized protein n=1 Tax=Aquatica leii TaxID=1421715 RepID=A0AAN7PS21_9COLE|nr:hypothetical protein RN001_013672 [Aquatica leii]
MQKVSSTTFADFSSVPASSPKPRDAHTEEDSPDLLSSESDSESVPVGVAMAASPYSLKSGSVAEDNELAMTVLDLQNLDVTNQSVQTEEFYNNTGNFLKEILEVKNLLLLFDIRLQIIETYIQGGERRKVCYLRRNMGNNEKDCIYKILHSCFSLDLARRCSLMGKHNNIKLDGMAIINAIKDAALQNYPNLTNEKFKSALMDWFQSAELRHKRYLQKQ